MKKLTITVVFILSQVFLFSQTEDSCLPEGITFTTQNEIDNFSINNPNCTEILGNVEIGSYVETDITSLQGLEQIESIGGNLIIFNNSILETLSGLHNINSVGGDLLIGFMGIEDLFGNEILSSVDFNNLNNVGGEFQIMGNPELTDLSSLINLTEIEGDLTIWHNGSLQSLIGLVQLTTIGGIVNIGVCSSLISLSGLQNITSTLGIRLVANEILTDITAFSGLTITGGIWIQGNPLLTNLNGLNNLVSINGSVLIALCPGILNLTGLNSLTNIGGFLSIQDNENLENFEGLNMLSTISDGLFIQRNNSLLTLSGLDQLTYIGGSLQLGGNWVAGYGNSLLSSIAALGNLSGIGGDFCIRSDSSLSNLSGLENLTSVGGSFSIIHNPVLSDLSALGTLTSINGFINIQENMALYSLEGLNNIEGPSIDSMYIMYNQNLTTCEVNSICEFLSNPSGEVWIYANAPGCNSPEEVQEACDSITSVAEHENDFELVISPNPVSDFAEISLNSPGSRHIEISLYNTTGICVKSWHYPKSQNGKNIFILDLKELPKGIYFCRVEIGSEIATSKVVKY